MILEFQIYEQPFMILWGSYIAFFAFLYGIAHALRLLGGR